MANYDDYGNPDPTTDPNNPANSGNRTQPPPVPGASQTFDPRTGIISAYKKYMTGRKDPTPSEAEIGNWIGNGNYEKEIANSPEAKAYAAGTPWNPNTGNTATPAGFDQTKWNDPNKHDPKYDVGRILAQHPNDMENALPYIQQLYPGTTFDGKDTITIPGYGSFDVLQGRSTGAWTPQWLPTGNNGDGTGGANYTNASGTQVDHNGNQLPATSGMSGVRPGEIVNETDRIQKEQDARLRQQLIDTLMARSTQSLNVDAKTDPNIRNQADPYAAAQTRAARSTLSSLAEKSSPYSDLSAQTRLANEHAAQNSGGFEAQLIGREIDARRQEIQSALTSMGNLLTEEQRQALTRELAQLSDATQRYGIDSSATTAKNAQNLSWNEAMMQNQQFLDQLGFNTTDRASYWDAVRSGAI